MTRGQSRDGTGVVDLRIRSTNGPAGRLRIRLGGRTLADGELLMTRSAVTFGPPAESDRYRGRVRSLHDTALQALVGTRGARAGALDPALAQRERRQRRAAGRPGGGRSPVSLPRLLAGVHRSARCHSREHRESTAARAETSRDLLEDVARAGLRGRGGAAFPAAVKMRRVARRRGPRALLVNAAEGEPMSAKDARAAAGAARSSCSTARSRRPTRSARARS